MNNIGQNSALPLCDCKELNKLKKSSGFKNNSFYLTKKADADSCLCGYCECYIYWFKPNDKQREELIEGRALKTSTRIGEY